MRSRLMSTLTVVGLLIGCSTSEPIQHDITLSVNYMATVPMVEDADRVLFLLDTGSPRTQLRPSAVGLPDDIFTERPISTWDPQGLYDGVSPIIVSSKHQDWAAWPLQPFGGLIGVDLLRDAPIAFDPRNQKVFLGSFDPEKLDVLPPLAIPVGLKGAGSTCFGPDACYAYDANRMVFDIDLEGVKVHAILDTGSAWVSICPELLEKLPARANRPQFKVITDDGLHAVMSRADIRVQSATILNVIVHSGVDDTKFLKLEIDTGEHIEAIVGSTFLSSFVTAVDFQAPSLTLYQYRSTEHIDENIGHGIGVLLKHEDHCFRVIGISEGAPAQNAGIKLGDCILAIDGKTPESTGLYYMTEYISNVRLGTVLQIRVAQGDGEQSFEIPTVNLLPPMKP